MSRSFESGACISGGTPPTTAGVHEGAEIVQDRGADSGIRGFRRLDQSANIVFRDQRHRDEIVRRP